MKKTPKRQIIKNPTKILTRESEIKRPLSYVLAPGGYRLQSLVKRAPKSKKGRSAHFNDLKEVSLSTAALNRQYLLNNPETFIDNFGPPSGDTLNPNWMAYAGWNNTTSTTIGRFTVRCRVPPAPSLGYQTIFIFMGMENAHRLLQPVLQWGYSKMGGGDFWSIGSCYAGGQNERVIFLNEMMRVQPGQELKAVIELTGRTADGCRYNCFFEGFTATFFPTDPIPELRFCCVTLESYHVENRNEYPSPDAIAMSDIYIEDEESRSILAAWNSPSRTGILGEKAILRRTPGEPDKIDLFY